MRNRWLFKTEPSEYSFERLQKEKRTSWTGVKNPLALSYLRKVRKEDEIFIYHTGTIKSIVGIARAVADARSNAVEIAPIRSLKNPVSLASIRHHPGFAGFDLVRLPRLSVMPVSDVPWKKILSLAGE